MDFSPPAGPSALRQQPTTQKSIPRYSPGSLSGHQPAWAARRTVTSKVTAVVGGQERPLVTLTHILHGMPCPGNDCPDQWVPQPGGGGPPIRMICAPSPAP